MLVTAGFVHTIASHVLMRILNFSDEPTQLVMYLFIVVFVSYNDIYHMYISSVCIHCIYMYMHTYILWKDFLHFMRSKGLHLY